MPRMRYVKPQFWSSPGVEGLDPWSRLLYIAMWTWADDFGRGTAEPRQLLGYAFPHDEIELADFRRSLGGIRRNFGVIFYKVGGRRYYSIPSWESHQKVDKRGAVRHPAPDQGEEYDPDPPDLQKEHDSEFPSEIPPSSLRDVGGNSALEVGSEGGRELGVKDLPASAENAIILTMPATAPAARYPAVFEKAWIAYERKGAKADSYSQWKRAIQRASPEKIIAAIPAYVAATAKDPKFRKDFERWLKGDCWESAVVESRATSNGHSPFQNPLDQSVYDEPLG